MQKLQELQKYCNIAIAIATKHMQCCNLYYILTTLQFLQNCNNAITIFAILQHSLQKYILILATEGCKN